MSSPIEQITEETLSMYSEARALKADRLTRDYTQLKGQWLSELTLDQIFDEITANRAENL